MREMEEKIKIEVTKEEHIMITALLMMHHIGLVIPIHADKRPLLEKLAQRFSIENIRHRIKPPKEETPMNNALKR